MSAFSPLTTWVESSPSTTLWGEIHGGGLGDGGRTCWWDWIFGPNLNDANANISVELSTYGFLGIGKANAFISIECVGNLLYESLDDIKDFGRFPNTTWLESVGTSRIFPLGQSSSLGDGGRFCWWDWFFGPSYFFEVESCNIDVELAAILNIQIPDADTSITFNISGSLLNTNTAVWNPSYRGIDIVLEDNYLTAQAPSSSNHGVRCQQNHITGKYYFEFKQKTLNGNDFAIGLANDSVDNRIVLGGTGSWFWMEDVLYEDGVSSITWTANNGDYTNAIAVDLDAGKCWFYSESAGIWYNSGDPSAGTDPTFIGVSGKIAPIFNGASNLSDIVDVTANFGETTFVHSPPVGFNAWNSAEPLIGTIDITLSVTGTVSIVLYGSSTISFDTLGTFHVPRTLLSNADSLITIDLLAALVIQTVHHVSYTTQVIHNHHTSWETDIGVALFSHEVSWSLSASELHTASYSSYIPSNPWNVHETSWLSLGGTSTIVAAHETTWLSSGSTSTVSMAHEVTWDSFVRIPGYAVHEVSWNSAGATSLVLSTHTASWASSGASSASASASHTTAWTSLPSINITHTTSYQSVVEDFAIHTHTWKSFVQENVGIHEVVYRSYTLDPQFVLANAYIEPDIQLLSASVTADEDSPYYQCEVELRNAKDYQFFVRDQAFILHLFADEYHFVVDSKGLSRTIDDEGNYQESATISGLSPLCLQAAPRSTPITKTWVSPTYVSEIVEELIGPVTWNLVDWMLPGYRLAADKADPFELAQNIVTAAGGLLESQPDGSVVVRHRWPISIAELDSGTPTQILSETSIFSAQQQPTQDVLMNRIRIMDSNAGYQDRLEYEPYKLANGDDDPFGGLMYAYLSPWRDGLRIVTTRGSKIQIGLQTESVKYVYDLDAENTAETITFENGQSSVQYPIMTLGAFEWLDEDLGGLTFTPYATNLEASATGTYSGYSLAKIAYTSRRIQVPIRCTPTDTNPVEAQFLLLENQ